MQPRKFRILSAVTAGSLAFATVAITASSGTSPTAKHAALAAQGESFPPVNLNACPILQAGYPTGGCVAQLQTDLNLIQGDHLVADGTFGSVRSQTYAAVIAFQQAHGLPQDGVVGPATKQALDTVLSVPTPTVPPATAPAPSAPAPGTSTASPAPGTSTASPAPGTSTASPAPGTSTASPASETSGGSGAAKYTRTSHSFFGDRACIAGYCAPIGQSWLWYDSTDPSGYNLSRIQLNWAEPEYSCSTWIDFDAWSTSGIHYWHIQGDTHTGCRFRDGLYALNDGADQIPSGAQAIVCGTLYTAGNPQPRFLTRTCVDVP